MKKVITTALFVLLISLMASGANHDGTLRHGHRPDAKALAKAKPERQLVPTRRHKAQTIVPGISHAPALVQKKNAAQARTAAMSAKASDFGSDLKLRGSVVSTWSLMYFPGLYYVPVSDNGVFEQIPGAQIIAEYAAWDDGNGLYYMGSIYDYGMGFVIPELYVYNTESWQEEDYIDCEFSILGTDNATDPTTGDVYGCYYDENYENLTWAKADYPNGCSHAIRTLDENEHMFGVACDESGQYYGLLTDGSFVKVNKLTGEFTKIGDTGLRPYYGTSASFDDKSGNFIFSYAPQAGNTSLWAIDPATGSATLIREFADNDQVTALEVIKPETDDKAPAAPQVTADAPDGGMEMNYTITMPVTAFNGSELSGELSWLMLVDGTEGASGSAACGATVSGTYTLESKGAHSIAVYAGNEVGRSPATRLTVINGYGVPKAPEHLGINNFGGGEIGLYWNAVTESADGAYVDPKAITYTVIRNGVTVGEGITDTWFDETVEIPDTYLKLNYEVKAVYAGNESEASTVSTGVGAITPPYAATYGNPNDSDRYTAINVNNDSGIWWFSPYYGSYIYDYSSEAADDWLISPAFALEAGKTYELSYSISGNSAMYTERYAVAMGAAPTAGAMVTQLLPATEICGERSDAQIITLTIEPKSDGNYYFGWHAMSDASMFQIHLKDIKLSAPMTATSPSEATDIVLTPDAEGHLTLQGSFKAPATDISGNPLAAVGKISVTRGDKTGVVAEFTSATPGATLQFTDSDIPQRGNYTYYVNCNDSDGNSGREASASVYVGPAVPANVPTVYMAEGSTPGTVTVSWKAPATDINGIDINPANLSYMIYVAGEHGTAIPVLDEPTTELQAEFTVCAPTEKAFATFYIEALNLGLESKGMTRSPMIPVGKPDALPFKHSFNSSDRAEHLLGYEVLEGSLATVTVSNMAESGVPAVDGDDAFLKLNNSTQHSIVNFFTGKISMESAASPAVSFYHYKWSDSDTNSFDVMVFDSEGNGAILGSCDHSTDGNVGWNFAQFPIKGFTGKDVYIYIAANFKSHEDQFFDVLTVADRHDIDLVASGLTAPARVEAAKEFTLTASVANSGLQTVGEYSVDLLLNGTVIATEKGVELAPGAQTAVTFRHTLSPLAEGNLEFTARVNVSGDGNEADNLSQPATPQLVVSKFPAVTDLAASRSTSGVELSWSAPSTDGFDVKETEDFEDATPWTEEVEGWTMIDRDGQQIGTLDGAGLPDAVAMRTSHSFFVFDNESDDILFYNPDLAFLCGANSGSKSIVAMYILNPMVSQDDWAISPTLSGEAQTLSFYARSFHPEYPDHMEVLYSEKDSTDPDDFISLCPEGAFEVPQLVDAIGNAAYKYYEFELPDGARRFALRAINPGGDGFMLMIDDVKFRQANATLAVNSYDVYRDGIKANSSPVAETSYLDVPADGQPHSYNVVVNYNRGLSPASNTVSVEALSVGNTIADSAQVSVRQREIVVSGAAGVPVRLYAVDGRELYRGEADCSISALPGSYVITVGTRSLKVVVK